MKRLLPFFALLVVLALVGLKELRRAKLRTSAPAGAESAACDKGKSAKSEGCLTPAPPGASVQRVAATPANPLTASTPIGSLTCGKREKPKLSCFDEAELHEMRVEIMRAKDLYGELCNQGSGDACYRIGLLYRDSGTPRKMADFYRRACDLKHSTACFNITLIQKSIDKIKQMIDASAWECSKEASKECHNAATLYRETAQIESAIPLYVVACQAGAADSCMALGEIARASESPVEAKLRFRKACDLKHADGCEAWRHLK